MTRIPVRSLPVWCGAAAWGLALSLVSACNADPSPDSGRSAPVPAVAGVETQAPAGASKRIAPRPAALPWPSGIWIGGAPSVDRVTAFETWRGSRVDVVTTYPAYETWAEIKGSDWHIKIFRGFDGKLAYGLPLLPKREGTFAEVTSGARDDVWRKVARDLKRNGRGDSFVRVGLEANGDWFPWGSDAQRAPEFIAAFRHVVGVMRSVAPKLSFVFDIGCGAPLVGGNNRLDALTALYPGDDVVDVVGCDVYDAHTAKVRSASEWRRFTRPTHGPGVADVAEFAREHGKKFAVPEWGLTKPDAHGSGDNAVFIKYMYGFFAANAADLAFENYFNEPAAYLESSLWEPTQNAAAAKAYRQLWRVKARS